MAGAGDPRNDWNDEGPLSYGAHSNAAALWQDVLYADGYIKHSDINCKFGKVTTAATKKWQKAHKLTATGVVNGKTFAAAGRKLTTKGDRIYYKGPKYTYWMERDSKGRYTNGKQYASYTSANACKA